MDTDSFTINIKTEDFYKDMIMLMLLMLLKKDVTDQVMKSIDCCLEERIKIYIDVHRYIHRCIKANDKYMENYNKKQRIIISYVFRCKQFAWMGNIPKTACKQFGKQIHLNLIKNLLKIMMKIVKKNVFLK